MSLVTPVKLQLSNLLQFVKAFDTHQNISPDYTYFKGPPLGVKINNVSIEEFKTFSDRAKYVSSGTLNLIRQRMKCVAVGVCWQERYPLLHCWPGFRIMWGRLSDHLYQQQTAHASSRARLDVLGNWSGGAWWAALYAEPCDSDQCLSHCHFGIISWPSTRMTARGSPLFVHDCYVWPLQNFLSLQGRFVYVQMSQLQLYK